jgi:hypothetical protein
MRLDNLAAYNAGMKIVKIANGFKMPVHNIQRPLFQARVDDKEI